MRTTIALVAFAAGAFSALYVQLTWAKRSAHLFTRIPPGYDPTYIGPKFRNWDHGVEVAP